MPAAEEVKEVNEAKEVKEAKEKSAALESRPGPEKGREFSIGRVRRT